MLFDALPETLRRKGRRNSFPSLYFSRSEGVFRIEVVEVVEVGMAISSRANHWAVAV